MFVMNPRVVRFFKIRRRYFKHRRDWANRFAGTDMMYPKHPSGWQLIKNQWSSARAGI